MLTHLRHGTPPGFTSVARAATGRSLVAHLIARVRPGVVLLPCYAPDGLTEPCRLAGVPAAFYRLRSDLTPDLDDIRRLLDVAITSGGSVPPLVVVIHYFGYPTPTSGISMITKKADGFLLESCAQALPGTASRHADFALYSINKWLPVIDGAILKSRATDVTIEHTLGSFLPARAVSGYAAHLAANQRIAEAPGAAAALDAFKNSSAFYDAYYAEAGGLMDLRRQGDRSRELEDMADFAAIGERHQTNAAYLMKHLRGCTFVRTLHRTAPWCLPILVGKDEREKLAVALFERGIHTMMQIDRWDAHVPAEGPERDFIDRHLLLPIGYDATLAQLETMVKVIKGVR